MPSTGKACVVYQLSDDSALRLIRAEEIDILRFVFSTETATADSAFCENTPKHFNSRNKIKLLAL
jgi:hypothetical protein